MTPKKILFATAPFDGHFSPLTGLAVHLQNQGHDVRWYAQNYYAKKIAALGIIRYPFLEADQVNQENLDAIFPERKHINNKIRKINFDIQHIFVKQGPLYYRDIRNINEEFDFDLMIADNGFAGVPYVKELMHKPVFTIGVMPLSETSKDLAPTGLGLTPAKSFAGRLKQDFLRFMTGKVLFAASNKLSKKILAEHGIQSHYSVFDEAAKRSTLLLQSGSPGFEYHRSDLSSNVRFIGPLLPYSTRQYKPFIIPDREKYEKVILVTQGTVEKDVTKIIVPVLEAYKGTNTLVVATTGHSQTEELRKKYPEKNIIIEDFIPFGDILPYCSAYISNGGYGGIMLGIQHKVPMVVAGLHEGKNEICARVGYFKLGIDLKTERPRPSQIKKAVEEVTRMETYRHNISRLANELSSYDPCRLLDQYIESLFRERHKIIRSGAAMV